jgi:hypothetical protein
MSSPEQDMNRVASSIGPDLKSYRAAILDLVAEITVHTEPLNLNKAERVLLDRLEDQELNAVLANTPKGSTGTIRDLLFELRRYRPANPSCPGDLTRLVRIFLTSQIDVMWWGRTRPFQTDADLLESQDLVDLEALRRSRPLRFQYRCQPETLPSRLARAVERRIRPDRTPRTAGLRFARTRPETVALLEQLSDELAQVAPADTPRPWVTSMARSVSHQHRLRSLGYPTVLPSSHCVGYAVDLEMTWFRRFRADRALAYLLLERQDCGDANIIDEGQVWHMCVNPAAAARLRDEYEANAGV